MDEIPSRTKALAITRLGGALGARVDGIDLRHVDDGTMDQLRVAFREYGVLVYPNQQHLSPEGQVAFAMRWGDLHYTPAPKACLEGNPAVLVLDTHGGKPVTDKWHSDISMDERPPMASFLLGRVVPVGGDTIFANQYLAYDALSAGMKRMLDGLRAAHTGDTFGKDGNIDSAALPKSLHPVVRTHPETGRKALYVNSVYTRFFEEMTIDESEPLLHWLCDHATQPNFTFRHQWTSGDLVQWDNRCVQHYGVADYGSSPRTMHRVTVLGDRPR